MEVGLLRRLTYSDDDAVHKIILKPRAFIHSFIYSFMYSILFCSCECCTIIPFHSFIHSFISPFIYDVVCACCDTNPHISNFPKAQMPKQMFVFTRVLRIPRSETPRRLSPTRVSRILRSSTIFVTNFFPCRTSSPPGGSR